MGKHSPRLTILESLAFGLEYSLRASIIIAVVFIIFSPHSLIILYFAVQNKDYCSNCLKFGISADVLSDTISDKRVARYDVSKDIVTGAIDTEAIYTMINLDLTQCLWLCFKRLPL